jgi:hypothetical protein
MKLTIRLILLVFLLAVSLTACGGGSSSSADTQDDTPVVVDDQDDTTDENDDTDEPAALTYKIAPTAQTKCYSSADGTETACTGRGYDADYGSVTPSYTDSTDTITDNITGLMWTKSTDLDHDGNTTDADDKLSYSDALVYCSDLSLSGYTDWRLPDIKTLYSLILFTGEDPSSYTGTDTSGLETFLYSGFSRAFGDTSAGERIIDGQYASSTKYVHTTMNGDETMFGVNFVDGRIKGYPLTMGGSDKLFYVLCVRGGTAYGVNSFTDNNDQTVTDQATGLMWQKSDTHSDNFEDAVSGCESASTAGYTDWRLPDVKELHSISDYTRSPDTTSSPAINSVFSSESFTNEKGETDWGYTWSSTTHADYSGKGLQGAYVSFGRALGYMNGSVLDVHGAGAQRSNSKSSEADAGAQTATAYDGSPFYYKGPQGDILRIDNMYRCVRDAL